MASWQPAWARLSDLPLTQVHGQAQAEPAEGLPSRPTQPCGVVVLLLKVSPRLPFSEPRLFATSLFVCRLRGMYAV